MVILNVTILDKTVLFGSAIMVTSNVALCAGSSQHGKARLQSAALDKHSIF